MKKVASHFIFVLWLAIFAFASCKPFPEQGTSKFIEVSMTQLLAFPQQFNGKHIVAMGYYYSRDFESCAIYLTRDDALIGNIQSSIAIAGYKDGRIVISADSPSLDNKFIVVSGMFVAGPTGHSGLWPGMIYPVDSISVFDEKTKKWVPEKTRPAKDGER